MILALAFVLIFFNFLNRTSADLPNTCINQSYRTGVPLDVMNNFRSEFSKFEYAKSKFGCIFGTKQVPYSIGEEMSKQLCACALYKRNEKAEPHKVIDDEGNVTTTINISQPFEEILEQTSFSNNRIIVPIWYSFFRIWHKFSTIVCYSGADRCALVRGLKKNSDERPVYNIYVGGFVTKDEKIQFQFQGIIEDVDVELRARSKKSVPLYSIIDNHNEQIRR